MQRVGVTTSREGAPGLAAELVAVGLQPVVLPCVRVDPGSPGELARAKAAAEEADILVLGSPKPLDLLWPDATPPSTPVAVIDEATAARVEERGGRVFLIGGGGVLDLAVEVAEAARGKTIAFPHAATVDPRAIVALTDAAGTLTAVPVYHAQPVSPPPDVVDAVTFASPFAVYGWSMARNLGDVVVAAMGAPTVGALSEIRCVPDVVTRRSSFAALAEALAAYVVGD